MNKFSQIGLEAKGVNMNGSSVINSKFCCIMLWTLPSKLGLQKKEK